LKRQHISGEFIFTDATIIAAGIFSIFFYPALIFFIHFKYAA